jgi:hypothetical protein
LSKDEINRILDALDPRQSCLRDLTNEPSAPQSLSAGVSSGSFLGGFLDRPPSVPTNALRPQNPFAAASSVGLLGDLFNRPPPMPTNALSQYASPPVLPTVSYRPTPAPVTIPEVKRKVYFAFSFIDIVRVNNVRQIGKIGPRESRNARTFYDRSIWEQRSITNDDGLKNLMRNGVKHSSAVCVLIGTDTWDSRWVKYEIARAVSDGRGLFGVHINSLNHHVRRAPDPPGYNPLHLMGVYRDLNGKFYLWEKSIVIKNVETGELGWEWQEYEDYTDPILLPRYIADVGVQHVIPLSWVTRQYDFVTEAGAKNIGAWIDAAAANVGR